MSAKLRVKSLSGQRKGAFFNIYREGRITKLNNKLQERGTCRDAWSEPDRNPIRH